MPHQLSPPPPLPSPPTPVLAPFIAFSIASPIHFPGRLLPCSNSQYCFRLLSHPAPNLPQQSRPTSDTCTLPSSLYLHHFCSVNRVFVQPSTASCFAATCHQSCGANPAVHQPERTALCMFDLRPQTSSGAGFWHSGRCDDSSHVENVHFVPPYHQMLPLQRRDRDFSHGRPCLRQR